MKNENTNTTSANITMNVTADLAALIAIVKQHGYSVTLRKAPAAPSDVDKENGMKLRELRKSLGLKQYQFAEKIHRNKNYVSTIEKGRARVSFRYSQAVYEAFRVYPDIKFHEVEKETNNIISL